MVNVDKLTTSQTIDDLTRAAVQAAQSLGFGKSEEASNWKREKLKVPQRVVEIPAWLDGKQCPRSWR